MEWQKSSPGYRIREIWSSRGHCARCRAIPPCRISRYNWPGTKLSVLGLIKRDSVQPEPVWPSQCQLLIWGNGQGLCISVMTRCTALRHWADARFIRVYLWFVFHRNLWLGLDKSLLQLINIKPLLKSRWTGLFIKVYYSVQIDNSLVFWT